MKKPLTLLDFSPMSPAEYVAAVEELGLTVSHGDKTKHPKRSAAHVFGYSSRQSRHYAAGTRIVSPELATLLRLVVAQGYDAETLNKSRR